MALSTIQSKQIKDYLVEKIRNKLTNYTPETKSMPFHFRLLGKDRMALFSFIQSVNTMLGTSIFEQIGKMIAEPKANKPNINEFIGIKKQLLDWIAMRGSIKPEANIKTIVAIPYNPYEPKPYERWTLQGLFDLSQEVLVGSEFWNLLGGENTYEDLLRVFEQAGLELYDEIDKKIKTIN